MTLSGHRPSLGNNLAVGNNPGLVLASDRPVTLVGGGPLSAGDLNMALTLAPSLVAADGGAAHCLAAGLTPLAVIGDMDSIPPAAREAYHDRLHPVAEQDSTDFDKALTRIAAPLVIALGFSGGRLDHELAALHSLVLHPSRACIILGPESLAFHCPPDMPLHQLAPGTPVSLFPFAPVRVHSRGLRWPTRGIAFSPQSRIGTSNEAVGPRIQVSPTTPGLLVILPRETLPGLARDLPVGRKWPARSPSRGG